ncbi:MAG: hypothetical protein LBU77_03200, partial [Clostridiales bacterium]|nr:hypothetical protein [Clostridiales bacterium]
MDEKRPVKNKSIDSYISQDTADYEGVRYTPSARRGEEAPPRSAPERRVPAPPQKKKPLKKQNSQFAIFFISTVFIGMVVCLIVFAVVFSSIIGDRNEDNQAALPTPTEAAQVQTDVSAPAASKEMVAVITEIMPSNKTLSLFSLESNESFSLSADANTVLTDKYGNTMVLAEFSKGEIVDAAFDDAENRLHAMQS